MTAIIPVSFAPLVPALPLRPTLAPHLSGARLFYHEGQGLWIACLDQQVQPAGEARPRYLDHALFMSGNGEQFLQVRLTGLKELTLPLHPQSSTGTCWGEIPGLFEEVEICFAGGHVAGLSLLRGTERTEVNSFTEQNATRLQAAGFWAFSALEEARAIAPPEAYVSSVVRPMPLIDRSARELAITRAHFNLFGLQSDEVMIDLLTDSGTGAISNEQLAAIIRGDESYAGSRSFRDLSEAVAEIMGFPYLVPAHQGRGAENILCSVLVTKGCVIPGNAHFDTTKGHIESRGATALDCTIPESKDPTHPHPFKGNLDLGRLEEVLRTTARDQIPFVLITITCNSGGGQPVSMENIRAVKALCERYGVRLFFDAARFAENAYFIKTREEGYADCSIAWICRKMFEAADGCTMSAKKDGISAMGGFVALRSEELHRQCMVPGILCEGFTNYGGMTGGTMGSVAQGLREATDFDYLRSRVGQVHRLGTFMQRFGIPIIEPVGGHAVYVDALRFAPHIPREQYPAQALAVAAYIEGGVRGVEIGTVLADRDPLTRAERYPTLEMVRLAIPRRTYSDIQLAYVVRTFAALFKQPQKIRGLRIVWEPSILRHFTCQFERVA